MHPALMQMAIDMAIENARTKRGGPFAAVIARGGDIIATGTNLVTSTNDPTAHAEVVAIRTACRALGSFQLSGCDLYTSCEPCPMCLGAIYWARPDRVFFGATREDAAAAGFDDDEIYREIVLPASDRRIPMSRLMAEVSGRPFDAWVSLSGRVPY